jgi:RNA polymerase sigma-70 factor (ECF subfamily)
VQELLKKTAIREAQPRADGARPQEPELEERPKAHEGLEMLEEVAKLLGRLPTRERHIVRLYYLEGRTYEEIAIELNIPINSIGPILSRSRAKLRKGVKSPPPVHKIQPQSEPKDK